MTTTPSGNETCSGDGVFCVLATTDKDAYTFGELVFITVAVTANGQPVEGASVHVEIITAAGQTIAGDGTTDVSGQVTFSLSLIRRMGSGTYSIAATATATISGTVYTVTDAHTFTVN